MVANPDGADTPIGVWLDADVGQSAPPSKTGRAQVKAGGKGTQGGSGSLAFRPGWHLGDLPRASQFDRVNPETGKKELFPENFVWAEVEYAKDVDYQEEAMSYGYTENGKFRHAYAGLPRLPENGYYRYRTNPKPDTVPWIITGSMKVNRLLSDAEVNEILEKNGVAPVHRQGGDVGLEKFGFDTTQYSLSNGVDNEQNLAYNGTRGESYVRTDEFRNLQAESQRMSAEELQGYHRGDRTLDESVRGRLSGILKRQVATVCGSSSNDSRLLRLGTEGKAYNIYENVNGELFHDAFEISRQYLQNGELVDLHTAETTEDGIGYNDCYNYLSDDGLSGFSITPDGDLISVFNASGKNGFLRAISDIVKSKAKTLDCYASPKQNLMGMYEKVFGFKPASVMDYNMEYDHDDIAKNHSEPKVAFMVNTESNVELREFGKDQYDEAVEYRNSFVNQAATNEAASFMPETDDIAPTKYSLSANARSDVHSALVDKKFAGEVKLTDTSPAILLSQKGVRNLPMVMNASHIRENIFTEAEAESKGFRVSPNINYHGLGEDLFLKVIDDLDNVREAYRGTKNADDPDRRENYFLLISQQTDKDGNVINVPVFINEKGVYNRVFIDTNKIATVFGRSELAEYIKRQIARGNLVRIKNRSTQASESTSPIKADYGMSASSNENVAQDGEDVKTQFSLSDSLGYHAGDLGKAEGYWNMMSANRGTGHFGTGTYFVGDEAKISDSHYGNRPHEKVDFSNYHLFKPVLESDGFDLHSALKYINDNIFDYPTAKMSFDEMWDVRKQVDEAEYTLWDDDATDAEKATAQKVLDDFKERFESVGYDPARMDAQELYEELNDITKEYHLTRSKLEMIFWRDMGGLSYEEQSAKIDSIMQSIYDEVSQIKDAYNAKYEDSPSTRFMKALGYEGIDVRGFKGLDNTTYGSVIYDLKGEDLARKQEIGTARYSLSDSNGNELSPAVQKRFAKSKVVDEDGNLNPTDNPDINLALSEHGEGVAPIGNFDFYGKDFRKKATDAVAPVAEATDPVVTDTNVGSNYTEEEAPISEAIKQKEVESVVGDRDSFVSQQAMELYEEKVDMLRHSWVLMPITHFIPLWLAEMLRLILMQSIPCWIRLHLFFDNIIHRLD